MVEMIIFWPRLENYQFSPTSSDIFDIWQHYIHILYLVNILSNDRNNNADDPSATKIP